MKRVNRLLGEIRKGLPGLDEAGGMRGRPNPYHAKERLLPQITPQRELASPEYAFDRLQRMHARLGASIGGALIQIMNMTLQAKAAGKTFGPGPWGEAEARRIEKKLRQLSYEVDDLLGRGASRFPSDLPKAEEDPSR